MQNARDLTAEIDRATDLAAGVNFGVDGNINQVNQGFGARNGETGYGEWTQNGVTPQGGVTTEQAQALGRGAIFGGNEISDQASRERIEAELMVSEDMNRERNPENFVGVETEMQIAERKAEDQEAMKAELGIGDPLTVRVTKSSLEGVAQEVAPQVDSLVKQPVYELDQLISIFQRGNLEALKAVGREIGGRN